MVVEVDSDLTMRLSNRVPRPWALLGNGVFRLIANALVLCTTYGVVPWASSSTASAAELDRRCAFEHPAGLAKLCDAREDAHKCAQEVEARQIRTNPQVVRRDPFQLEIPLLDHAKTVVIEDSYDVKYTYIEYLACLKHHLLRMQYYDGEAYALVSADTGTLLYFRDLPRIAPDARRFIAKVMNPLPDYERDAIQIWRVDDTKLIQEWSFAPKDWSAGEPMWLDGDSIRVDKFPLLDKAKQLKSAELIIRRTDGNWKIASEHPVPFAQRVDEAPPTAAGTLQIGPARGKVVLEGYASAIFKTGAFDQPTNVTVLATSDKDTAEIYDVSSWYVTAGPRLPYEIRVRTGTKQPREPVTLRITIPQAFLERLPAGYAPFVSIRIDQGNMDHFEGFGALFSREAAEMTAELPPAAFTNSRPFSRGAFEAVVIVGTADLYAPLPERKITPGRVTVMPAIRAKDIRFRLVGRTGPVSLPDGEIEDVAKGLLLLLNDCHNDTLHQPERFGSKKWNWDFFLSGPHVLVQFKEPVEMPHWYTACDIKTEHGFRCQQREETLRITAIISTLQGPGRDSRFPNPAIRGDGEDRFYSCAGNPAKIRAFMCTETIIPNLPDHRSWQETCRLPNTKK